MDRNILLPMTDFVLEQKKKMNSENEPNMWDYLKSHFRYAEFLKQPLELGMFVPCKNGIPLQPVAPSFDGTNQQEYNEYIEAKEKVFFNGFTLLAIKKHLGRTQFILMFKDVEEFSFHEEDTYTIENHLIGDLENQGYEIELTESAKIKIYGK